MTRFRGEVSGTTFISQSTDKVFSILQKTGFATDRQLLSPFSLVGRLGIWNLSANGSAADKLTPQTPQSVWASDV